MLIKEKCCYIILNIFLNCYIWLAGGGEGRMEDVLVLSSPEKVKIISDKLRITVLQILIGQKATVKQVADILGQSSAKIHYHVKELEKQNFIKIVEVVEKGGILEKYYRAVARNYKVDYMIS